MIVDASVAFKWIVPESDSATAIAWLGRNDLSAPALMVIEVGQAIGKRIRRGEMTATEDMRSLYGQLSKLVSVVPETPLMARAFEISLMLVHPLYDCVYLAMAEDQDDQLLTADVKFAEKASAAGFEQRFAILGHVP